MFTGHFSRALVATMLIVAAREVSAQEPLGGPPEAVPPLKPIGVVHHLDFGLGLYQGFDVTPVTEVRPTAVTDPRFYEDTSLSSVSGTLTYSRHSHDVDVGLSGGGNVRYFNVAPDIIPTDVFGAASVSSKFTRRTRIHASGNVSYSPYYSFGALMQSGNSSTAVLLPPTTEQNIARLDTRSYNVSAGLIWTPTRETTVDFGYNGYLVDTASPSYRSNNQGVNALMSHRTSRYSTLRLGYGYRTNELFGNVGGVRIHDITAGFGYQRPLSFSRHTVVGFSVGTSLIQDASQSTLVVIGDGSLVHQMTRRWSTAVYYRRDVDSFAGVLDLFITDNVSGALVGAFSRRVTFNVNGGFSLGRLANGFTNGYQATSAGTRLSYLVSRYVPIYGEYVFYHSDFQRGIGLAPGFPTLMTRHGLRAGLSYTVPLIGRRVR